MAENIYSLELDEDPPEDFVVLDVVVLLKCLNEDGRVAYWSTASKDLLSYEAYAMCDIAAAQLKESILSDDDDDEDE